MSDLCGAPTRATMPPQYDRSYARSLRRRAMIDREQAIEAILPGVQAWGSEGRDDVAEWILDAILALPDPVHEAARAVVATHDNGMGLKPDWDCTLYAIDRLRAALSAERVPTPITDEMVGRALMAWMDTPHVSDSVSDQMDAQMYAALGAALNGGER